VRFPPPGFDDLSVDVKIDYLELLWSRIAASPETVAAPEWHREVISERLRDLESDSSPGDRLRDRNDSSRNAG
jgi:Putative addiction module component